ncbi:glycosyltransferase [Candidatus Uhrbacteria bacterium]|nr:glycosyltransferase [Candidatus Uhrbacteria bacterium]
MKIALVHDHLTQVGGAERVLKIFHELFPAAPIYTLIHDRKKVENILPDADVRPSFLQRLPLSRKMYQWFLPLMPTATESYDLSAYDIVLSSASAFAKGVITKSTTLHICYCHTPTRYLWTDTHDYLRELRAPGPIKAYLPYLFTGLRIWDAHAAMRVDRFLANSRTVQERITKHYRRESTVMFPPVEVDQFSLGEGSGRYYLAGGRLVSYKRFDIIIDAFNRLGMPLKIFGVGPESEKLRKRAKPNIEFCAGVSDEQRAALYRDCIAYIHPQEEDFGITPIEAMASGRPVIAYAAGGALETILDDVTGTFFYDQDYAALIDAILHFDAMRYDAATIRSYAVKYSVDRFKKELSDFINREWNTWQELQEIKRLRESKMMF